jgi:dihydroorotase
MTMEILIRNAEIICESSPYHGKTVDIRISDGKIQDIGPDLIAGKGPVIEGNKLYATIGLCDIGTHTGEPGFEQRESLQSLSNSALAGGYTHLFTFPDTKPVIQTRADVLYLQEQAAHYGIQISPIGALSKDCKGDDISEFLDMNSLGVRYFSDGMKSVKSSGLIKRALQYASGIGGVILNHPEDRELSYQGEMHEGKTSTGLGLPGVPEVAEISMLHRDIILTGYTGGRLIAHAISCAESIEMIKNEAASGTDIQATVAYLNLIFTDEALNEFDSNLKVRPVLRSLSDQKKLIKGINDGVIKVLVSNHTPLEEELKKVEFTYATPGATGLESCLPACLTYLRDEIDIQTIINCLTTGPRKMMGIPVPLIDKGANAELCIFDADDSYTYTNVHNNSLSNNNPFFGTVFNSRIKATFNGLRYYIAR